MGRFLAAVVWRGFRRSPLVFLLAVALLIGAAKGWFGVPWESPVCEDHPHQLRACG